MIPNSESPLQVGGDHSEGIIYGYIDQLRISDEVRYRANFKPINQAFEPDEHTRALYHFDESGPPFADASGNGNTLTRWGEPDFPLWDVNRDGRVDMADITLIGTYFGRKMPTPVDPNPDLNGDGVVNILDLILVSRHFGETYAPAVPSTIK